MPEYLSFLPVVLFAVVYYFYNIYYATIALMAAMAIYTLYSWVRFRKVSKMILFSTILILIMGGLTLFLQDKMFIQWKPTLLCWVLAGVLFASQFFGRHNLLEKIFKFTKVPLQLPKVMWRNLNLGWGLGLAAEGLANLYFVYFQTESAWVLFKTGGHIGFTLVFIILTIAYLAKGKFLHQLAPKD